MGLKYDGPGAGALYIFMSQNLGVSGSTPVIVRGFTVNVVLTEGGGSTTRGANDKSVESEGFSLILIPPEKAGR